MITHLPGKKLLLILSIAVSVLGCNKNETLDQKDSNNTTQTVNISFSEDLMLPIESATGPIEQSGTPLTNAFDGSQETLYHSTWNGISLPAELAFSLKGSPQQLDYLYLYPRKSGANGIIQEGELWVATKDNPNFTKITNFVFSGGNSVESIILKEAISNPTRIKIVVTKTAGNTQGEYNKYVSLTEIQCWQNNPNKVKFLSYFTNGTCTEVKPGITRKELESIADTTLRYIALTTFDNKIDQRRIQECISYPNPSASADQNKSNKYGYVDNVTGIYLESNKDACIFVQDGLVAPLTARIINHTLVGLNYVDVPLKSGINKFKPSGSGLVYLIYSSNTPSKVKVYFARGQVNGYYDIDKNQPGDWNKIISNTVYSNLDLKGKYSVITFTTSALQAGITQANINDYIKTWDDIVYNEQEFTGLVKYNKMHNTRMYCKAVTDPDAYMYATDYFTAFQVGTLNNLNTPEKLRGSGIWGPAHEIGHVNQLRPGLKWPGTTEVTNNILSLYIQTTFNGLSASRIQSEDLGGGLTRYQKAFNLFFTDPTHNHFLDSDVFCKLVPFWQLQIYFSNVKGYTDFYKDVFEKLRIMQNPSLNEAHLEFMKVCCDLTHEDLTDFFTEWGLLRSFTASINDYATYNLNVTQSSIDAAVSYVKAKGYGKPSNPIQYIQDNTVDLYKNQTQFTKGSMKINNTTITLSGCSNAVVFRVKNTAGKIIMAYPPKGNSGNYTINAGTNDIGKVEAIDATGTTISIN
jgi:hypothetical protein